MVIPSFKVQYIENIINEGLDSMWCCTFSESTNAAIIRAARHIGWSESLRNGAPTLEKVGTEVKVYVSILSNNKGMVFLYPCLSLDPDWNTISLCITDNDIKWPANKADLWHDITAFPVIIRCVESALGRWYQHAMTLDPMDIEDAARRNAALFDSKLPVNG